MKKLALFLILISLSFSSRSFGQSYDNAGKDLFAEKINASPNDAQNYYARGLNYMSKSNFDLAILDFNRAIELNQDATADWTVAIYIQRARAFQSKGNFDLAIADLTKAITLNDVNYTEEAYFARANAYYQNGDFDRAVMDLTKLIETGASIKSSALMLRAQAHLEKRDYNKSWDDIHALEQMGISQQRLSSPGGGLIPGLPPNFIEGLKKASGRDK